MLVAIRKYSAFLKPSELNKICDQSKLKRATKNNWIRFSLTEGCLPQAGYDAGNLNGVTKEGAQDALLAKLERYKGVVGVRCEDCILVHPGPFARAWFGELKRRGYY